MFQKLLKVPFYSLRKLQHCPTALPALTGPDRTKPDRAAGSPLAALPQRGPDPGRPVPGRPAHGSVSRELQPTSRDGSCSSHAHRATGEQDELPVRPA